MTARPKANADCRPKKLPRRRIRKPGMTPGAAESVADLMGAVPR